MCYYVAEDAKKETEHLERRVELAERERDEVLLKAEEEQIKAEQRFREERLAINDTLKRERKARSDFQTALDTERVKHCLIIFFGRAGVKLGYFTVILTTKTQ